MERRGVDGKQSQKCILSKCASFKQTSEDFLGM